MTVSSFKDDFEKEKLVADFLDKYLYDRLWDEEVFKYERVNNKKEQEKGIDIIYQLYDAKNANEETIFVDEKSATSYIDIDLPTFVHEISFKSTNPNTDKILDGWFVKEGLKTNAYLYNYIKSEKGKKYIKEYEDIKQIESIYVMKIKLKNELKKMNIDNDLLKEASKLIRKRKESKVSLSKLNLSKTVKDKNISLFHSYNLPESPVNLLLKKEFLKKNARAHYITKKSGKKRLK